MKHFQLIALLIWAAAAVGDEHAPPVHVDIDAVVEAGTVAPADGITSAGQPNEAALEVFAESGYAVVIDMRGPDEDRGIEDFEGAVEATGMKYVAFPVVGQEAINFETARELDALLEGIDGPVLLHCGSGNRVGAVLALRESLAGSDDETAIQYGRDAGMTRLEPRVREVLEAE